MDLYVSVAIAVYVFNIVLGIPSNCTILYVYWKKKIWTASHFFIIGHAVVDLLICTVVLPIGTMQWLFMENFRNLFLCRLLMWVYMSAPLASLHVNTLVAFDRYFAVARPHVKFVRGRFRPAIVVILIIILAFIINVPQLIWRDIRETVREGESSCYFPDEGFLRVLVVYVLNTLVYLSHIIVTIFLYTKVYIRVKKLQRKRVGPANDSSSTVLSRTPNPSSSFPKEDNSYSSKPGSNSMLKLPHQLMRSVHSNDSGQFDPKSNNQLLIDMPKGFDNSDGPSSAVSLPGQAGPSTAESKSKRGNDPLIKTVVKTEGRNKALANATFRMLFIVTVVFTCTWFTQFVLRLVPKPTQIYMRAHSPVLYAAYVFATSLIIFNSSINVLIYGIVNRDFRSELKKLWRNIIKWNFNSVRNPPTRSQPFRAVM